MSNTKEVEQKDTNVPQWDWYGWLCARIPVLKESANKFWIHQCVEDLLKSQALSPLEQSENKEEWEWVKVTEDILLDLGFEKIPNFNVLNSFIKNIGRNRHISIGCVGTPNLMVFLCETDREDHRKVNDLICLHNWDYDGEIYLHQLQDIISALTRQERK